MGLRLLINTCWTWWIIGSTIYSKWEDMGERGAFLGKEQNLPIGPQKSTFLVSHLLHRMVNRCISYGGKKNLEKSVGVSQKWPTWRLWMSTSVHINGLGKAQGTQREKTVSVCCWLKPRLWWDCSHFKKGCQDYGSWEVWTPANKFFSRASDWRKRVQSWVGVGQRLRVFGLWGKEERTHHPILFLL